MFFLERSENQFFGAPSAYFMKKWRFWHPSGPPWEPKWWPKSTQIRKFIKSCNVFSAGGRFFSRPAFQRPQGHPPGAFWIPFRYIFFHFGWFGIILATFFSYFDRFGMTYIILSVLIKYIPSSGAITPESENLTYCKKPADPSGLRLESSAFFWASELRSFLPFLMILITLWSIGIEFCSMSVPFGSVVRTFCRRTSVR